MRLKSGSRCRLRKDRYGRMVAQVVREAALPATILMTRHGTAGYYRVRRSHHSATTRHRWPRFVPGFHGEPRCRFDFAFDPAAMYQCARSSREPVSTSPENTLNATPSARAAPGEVAEWSNAPHSKCGIGASLSGVRIPPSPPYSVISAYKSARYKSDDLSAHIYQPIFRSHLEKSLAANCG